VTRRVVRT